jgi:hypothetical protein
MFNASYYGDMAARIKKQSPSAHQKQIRFWTGLCIFVISLATALIFWLANQSAFPAR